MKWAEVSWEEPEQYPAMKSMKCEGCGWPITVAWANIESATVQFMADSPQAKGRFNPVESCPNCGGRLALYTMDLADDGKWHYVS